MRRRLVSARLLGLLREARISAELVYHRLFDMTQLHRRLLTQEGCGIVNLVND